MFSSLWSWFFLFCFFFAVKLLFRKKCCLSHIYLNPVTIYCWCKLSNKHEISWRLLLFKPTSSLMLQQCMLDKAMHARQTDSTKKQRRLQDASKTLSCVNIYSSVKHSLYILKCVCIGISDVLADALQFYWTKIFTFTFRFIGKPVTLLTYTPVVRESSCVSRVTWSDFIDVIMLFIEWVMNVYGSVETLIHCGTLSKLKLMCFC